VTTTGPQVYQLRVAGHLDECWSAWFGDLVVTRHADGTCMLTGPVLDQSQLHGVLARLRDIGATLLSLQVLDDGGEPGAGGALSSTDRRPVAPG
jgi:hypothetical protein